MFCVSQLNDYMQAGESTRYFLNNHLRFHIYYNSVGPDAFRIVAFEVEPFSVKHQYEITSTPEMPQLTTCAPNSVKQITNDMDPQPIEEGEKVIFTYDVTWRVRLDPLLDPFA
jgi:transmembrane 9 superfamily protein 2/4